MITRFRLMVHEAEGQKYEDLFVKIMVFHDPSFKPVKAHGNIGDRGNDGWVASSGKYYQCYAPSELLNNNKAAINKLKGDFEKLKSYWDDIAQIKEFYFVVNDKFKGAPPHIYRTINEIKIKYKLDIAEILLASQLEQILFNLPDRQIKHIVGEPAKNDHDHVLTTFYDYLIRKATEQLHLADWTRISENLIATGIDAHIIDSYSSFCGVINKTCMPGSNPILEESLIELSRRVESLVLHFTDSKHAFLSDDYKWWRQDMRWKKILIKDQVKLTMLYEADKKWVDTLFIIHANLVVALNQFADAVRKAIAPGYFMRQKFVISDSMGVYNNMVGCEFHPSDFVEIDS
ncbi:hypothetical protein IFR09_11480 [Pseudomonas syringae]|nr:hypothetical protein [Pseudomonas syringae]MBD8801864.1 hypothetical protein [Pseudomonas syringae]MBD8811786.1 hypothetical protein [Pseudomonas syringae]